MINIFRFQISNTIFRYYMVYVRANWHGTMCDNDIYIYTNNDLFVVGSMSRAAPILRNPAKRAKSPYTFGWE